MTRLRLEDVKGIGDCVPYLDQERFCDHMPQMLYDVREGLIDQVPDAEPMIRTHYTYWICPVCKMSQQLVEGNPSAWKGQLRGA